MGGCISGFQPTRRVTSGSGPGPRTKITKRKDGTIVLTMETSEWWDVKKWALAFGADAEVLEPVETREEIRMEHKRALAGYER